MMISGLPIKLYHTKITLKYLRSFSYFTTTPIFYVNASPHIGHVHTLFLADAINIYNRLKLGHDKTILSTGTDEHGIKIQAAAEANQMACQEFCNSNAGKFSNLFHHYGTSVTEFIRTTEVRHKKAVEYLWNELDKKGFIYKSTYSGWYCNSDEVFIPESQVIRKDIDGRIVHSDQNDNTVVWSSEENYMFRLSAFEEDIKTWLTREEPIVPNKFNDIIVKSMERSRIGDISISRPKNRLDWGIRVPNDPTQTIYVWLDALTSYLTVAGYPCDISDLKRWPIDCQVLGKDILKFHAIYWPAFLKALSLPLPKRLICHSHWTVDEQKMSKSRGNVVDPWRENDLLTCEGLRYYLLRASTNHSDTDYSRTQALRRVNSELADTYGNLISRCCGKAINRNQIIPQELLNLDDVQLQVLLMELTNLKSRCEEHFDKADFYKGVDAIMSILRLSNKVYEEARPWKLVKQISEDASSYIKFHNLQATIFEALRICSILLGPVVPKLSSEALRLMNVKDYNWQDAHVQLRLGSSNQIRKLADTKNFVLFQRLKAQI